MKLDFRFYCNKYFINSQGFIFFAVKILRIIMVAVIFETVEK